MLKRDFYHFVIVIVVLAGGTIAGAEANIQHHTDHRAVGIQSGDKKLALRINYSDGCFIDRFFVNNNQIIDRDNGISSAVKVNGYWHLSKHESKTTSVEIDGTSVTLENISYGPDSFRIQESWTFTATDNAIDWSIHRKIPSDMTVDAAANSHWEFAGMDTWTGAILDNGAVAWSKMLSEDYYTFGNHASKALFWNNTNDICFEVDPIKLNGQHMASSFTRSPKGTLVFAQALSDDPMETRVNLSRCLRDDAIWKPFALHQGTSSMTYRLSASQLDTRFDLGRFNGIDEDAVREILNTIVRYGVIDSKLCGANGWRTGYICLHEQWFAQMAMAIQDENYTHNVSETYDHFRDHAVLEDGRVLARFKDNGVDAMAGTYTEQGFYEAQWGYLLDSQPDYVMVVAEQFHNTGDMDWVRGQKQTCEAALEYLLKRDSDGDGLLEMINQSHADGRGSDWIDIIWAAHENALVNAEMYGAMMLWAEIEEILGDPINAKRYLNAAAKLKDRFNKNIKEGGFWNPEKKWYVYWRDKDDSIHGDNLVIPVNFSAIGYGLCDDNARRSALLSGLETAMLKENLFSWPLCVYPFKPEEGAGSNFPFPNYENGDIFLSWAELGTRAYAPYNPDIAMKYINNVVNQYKLDGLAFQRYGRHSQDGLGDDILAGNGMAVVGLYRNIFGIQPQYNRLYLEPHLPEELNGTIVKYHLRNKDYTIRLDTNQYTVTTNHFSMREQKPFGINNIDRRLDYFQGKSTTPSLSFERNAPAPLDIHIIHDNNGMIEWRIQSNQSMDVLQTVYNLSPGKIYHINVNTEMVEDKTADTRGCLGFTTPLNANQRTTIRIIP